MEVLTYLTFDGNCRQAMEFYRTCLGAELYVMPFSEAPAELSQGVQNASDRVMHASLTKGTRLLMASDTMPGSALQYGTNFSVCVQCKSLRKSRYFSRHSAKKGKSPCRWRIPSGALASACSPINLASSGCSTSSFPRRVSRLDIVANSSRVIAAVSREPIPETSRAIPPRKTDRRARVPGRRAMRAPRVPRSHSPESHLRGSPDP